MQRSPGRQPERLQERRAAVAPDAQPRQHVAVDVELSAGPAVEPLDGGAFFIVTDRVRALAGRCSSASTTARRSEPDGRSEGVLRRSRIWRFRPAGCGHEAAPQRRPGGENGRSYERRGGESANHPRTTSQTGPSRSSGRRRSDSVRAATSRLPFGLRRRRARSTADRRCAAQAEGHPGHGSGHPGGPSDPPRPSQNSSPAGRRSRRRRHVQQLQRLCQGRAPIDRWDGRSSHRVEHQFERGTDPVDTPQLAMISAHLTEASCTVTRCGGS